MSQAISSESTAQLFQHARSLHTFTPEPVSDATLQSLHELWKLGPTEFNSQPARVLFIRSDEAKQKLAPALLPNNLEKTLRAPVTALIAYDSRFYENMPTLMPHVPYLKALFENDAQLAERSALRGSSLQGGYLIIAARALGLSAGPMSGFNPEAVNKAFFADGRFKVNFLINLGYADATAPRPRGPRLSFDEQVQII